jgi:hypothetical protein
MLFYPSTFCIAVIILCTQSDRRVMIRAHRHGMTNGEFFFFTPSGLDEIEPVRLWYGDDEDDPITKEAYRVLHHVSRHISIVKGIYRFSHHVSKHIYQL